MHVLASPYRLRAGLARMLLRTGGARKTDQQSTEEARKQMFEALLFRLPVSEASEELQAYLYKECADQAGSACNGGGD